MKVLNIWLVFLFALTCFAEFTAEQILGVGYQPGDRLALVYSARGITSIKTTCFEWVQVESLPPEPEGIHNYNWNEFDSLIIKHQRSGIDEFCIWLGCDCWWATCPHWAPITTVDRRRPMPEFEDDFYDWVYNFVERYDGDGHDDVSGLLYPVRYYMMESEAQQFYYFEGCSYETHCDDYLAVLGIAYRAVKDANPEVQLGLAAVLFPDMFDDFPDSATMLERLRLVDSVGLASAFPDSVGTRSVRFMRRTICADSIYDFITFHPLYNWEGLSGQVGFIRSIMDSAGIDKPIFADDAVSGPMFHSDGFCPRLPEVCDSLYTIIGNTAHVLYPIVDPWFRAYQARSMTKNFVVALGLGVQRMWTETTIDWYWPYLSGIPSWAFIGLVDYNTLFPAFSIPRPALHTLKLLKNKFNGYRSVSRLEPYTDPSRIYKFRFSEGLRGDMLCVWFENHIDELPEEALAETAFVAIDFFAPNRRILLTEIITSRSDTVALQETLSTDQTGILILTTLGETPVFLEDLGSMGIAEISRPSAIAISAHPNPFNSAVKITLDGVGAGLAPTLVEIFDLNGRRVAQLPEYGTVGAGFTPARNDSARDNDRDGASVAPTTREFTWSPDETLPSGIYIVRARSDPSTGSGTGEAAVKRVVYMK